MRRAPYHPSLELVSRCVLALSIMAFVLTSPLRVADAHPFGLSSVNRYIGFEVLPRGGLHIAWLLDFAELPAAQEIARMDADRDGRITPAERDTYLDAFLPGVLAQWHLERNGTAVTPRVVHRAIEVQPGQSDLNTLRILVELEVPAMTDPTQRITVHIVDHSYAERTGMRDLRADDSDAARVISAPADVPVRTPDGTTLRRTDDATFVFELRAAITSVNTPRAMRHPSRSSLALGAGALLAWCAALAFALARRDCDPRVRLAIVVGFAITASAVPTARFAALTLLASFAVLGAVAVRPRARWLVVRLALALAWSAVIAAGRIATTHEPVTGAPLAMALRIATSLIAVIPLAATTSLVRFADALAALPLPRLFVDTTVSAARGVVILREEATRIARARMLRAPRAGFVARIALFGSYAGMVVERGLVRAERAHLAFTLRGGGQSSTQRRASLSLRDASALACALVAFILAAVVR